MTMKVDKTFLYDSNLHISRETAKVGADLQVDLNAAARGKTVRVPLQGGR